MLDLIRFPFYRQHDTNDCGPACLQMIAEFFGRNMDLNHIKENCLQTKNGVTFYGLSLAASDIGLKAEGLEINCEQILNKMLPAILFVHNNHFVVLFKIKEKKFYIADPAVMKKKMKYKEFMSLNDNNPIVKILSISNDSKEEIKKELNSKKSSFNLIKYWYNNKVLFYQIVITIIVGTFISLITPLLTQNIVDNGILKKNSYLIALILLAQVVLFLAQTFMSFIRGWILLFISTKINISIISNFFVKLMSLPLAFFESKKIGDILQRVGDHIRIENFFTTTVLNTLTAFILLLAFGSVLWFYNLQIFLIFFISSVFYLIWVLYFLKKRKSFDNERFTINTRLQSTVVQIVGGIHDVKYNNCETDKRWAYEKVQSDLYDLNLKTLKLNQLQQSGALFITQLKNIIITYLTATLVIANEMTLGGMLAIQFIIGQLNYPLDQMVFFIQSAQDAKLSFHRLTQIHNLNNEIDLSKHRITEIQPRFNIKFEKVSFKYGQELNFSLKEINLEIQYGKVTALVGASGSGKTTLLKLILKNFYVTNGKIKVADIDFDTICPSYWRSLCGVVMQDGYIFSESLKMNVIMKTSISVDEQRLKDAYKIANLEQFINNLPAGDNTIIGIEGLQVSQGEKQRILIARAIYKNPKILILDEATSSLDVNNEKQILNNLRNVLQGRTVIIVAHRLSTIRDADLIAVIDGGRIVEKGDHNELLKKKGWYHKLISNQLSI